MNLTPSASPRCESLSRLMIGLRPDSLRMSAVVVAGTPAVA
jgi:hypothetical protein